ncbi:MAG: ribosome maturation factor RimM [Candidatus Binatia bacterium]
MPSRPARTARSSSRSSKRSEGAPARAGLPSAPADATAVAVGEIGSPHGLRGGVRFWSYRPGAPSVTPGCRVLLERDGTWLAATVADIAAHGRGMLLVLEGIADRTATEALTGMRVLVRAADLPRLDPDEFYHHEVHGFAVVTTDGRALGTIAETLSTGLNDVWIVRGGDREHLIPIIADVVREIDRDSRRVVIEPMPGLLD